MYEIPGGRSPLRWSVDSYRGDVATIGNEIPILRGGDAVENSGGEPGVSTRGARGGRGGNCELIPFMAIRLISAQKLISAMHIPLAPRAGRLSPPQGFPAVLSLSFM